MPSTSEVLKINKAWCSIDWLSVSLLGSAVKRWNGESLWCSLHVW